MLVEKVMGGSWAIDRRAGWGDVAPSRRRWSRLSSLWSEECVALPMDETEYNADWARACRQGHSASVWSRSREMGRQSCPAYGCIRKFRRDIGDDLQLQIEGGGRQQVLHDAC